MQFIDVGRPHQTQTQTQANNPNVRAISSFHTVDPICLQRFCIAPYSRNQNTQHVFNRSNSAEISIGIFRPIHSLQTVVYAGMTKSLNGKGERGKRFLRIISHVSLIATTISITWGEKLVYGMAVEFSQKFYSLFVTMCRDSADVNEKRLPSHSSWLEIHGRCTNGSEPFRETLNRNENPKCVSFSWNIIRQNGIFISLYCL